jgi:PfaD family protein
MISFKGNPCPALGWQGALDAVLTNDQDIIKALLKLEEPAWVVKAGQSIGIANGNLAASPKAGESTVLCGVPAFTSQMLGDAAFCKTYNTRYALYGGAMANGIASEDMIVELGKAGFMGSFGAGGCIPSRVEAAILKIKQELPNGPYMFNLLNSPNEKAMEEGAVALYLKHGIRVIEASAYLAMTSALVHYRVAGLTRGSNGEAVIGNRVIAKISRKEVAKRFLEPAPKDILNQLVAENKITQEQADLSQQVPMADDITVEADSGGHTDNRPLVCMIPAFVALRDEAQAAHQYREPVRIGAAGGIGTPEAALAAFMMGAAYVVTGSVNQSCVESGASEHTRKLLAQMEMTDVAMAPAGDMFEMGVKVQVLKRGTMFSMRGLKLYELYTRYNSWDEVPPAEREKLEKTVFKRDFEAIWNDTVKFFMERDPRQIERANANPRDKMALVFRWYLGLSSRWSNVGEKGREMDYQIWVGPSMGSFNDWARGTYLEPFENRHVADVARQLLQGCAYLYRLRMLEMRGLQFPAEYKRYIPVQA